MRFMIECIGEYESKEPNSSNCIGYITSNEHWVSKNKRDESSHAGYCNIDDYEYWYEFGFSQCYYNPTKYKLTYWPKKRYILMDVVWTKCDMKVIKRGVITKLIDNTDVILEKLLK